MNRFILRLSLLCCLCGLASSASAQEVEWRSDYVKARKEAEEKNRPIVIDVGSENCPWCVQLDLRTFKDPSVVAFLNSRCVPIKIKAEQHPRLIEALHVETYPTLVFASSKGKILGYQVGFIEAAPLQERMNQLFAQPSPNAPADRYLQEAVRAVAAADYPRALAFLKSVIENSTDQPVRDQARQLLGDLEQQAAGRCAEARHLVASGKVTKAVETAAELVRVYPGTKAAREGGQLLVKLASRVTPHDRSSGGSAHDLLEQAREDQRQHRYLSCLENCENVLANYAGQPESAEAKKLADEIKANPEWTQQACDQMGERLSTLYLGLAETWIKNKRPQQAIFYLERIVQSFPNTRNAELARVRLAQIQGPIRTPAKAEPRP